MDYNIRINTEKKYKLKDQAARQKHYVQTLFELELHIISLNVQCSKMCYLLESHQRLSESALHPQQFCASVTVFLKYSTHFDKRDGNSFDVWIGKGNAIVSVHLKYLNCSTARTATRCPAIQISGGGYGGKKSSVFPEWIFFQTVKIWHMYLFKPLT